MTFKFLALIAIAACAPMTGLVAAGDTPAATAERQYPVEHLKLAYAQSNSRLPALAKLDSVLLHLKSRDGQLFTTDPWLDWMRQQDPSLKWMRDENMAHMMDFEVAVGSNLPEGSKFSEAAIREVSKAVVARLNQLGVAGVVVLVSQNDIDPQSRADLRPSGNRTLNLVIWASEISQVRTVAKGDRLPADAAVNNPLHARILKGSPLTVATDGNPALLNKTELQDYLRRLNRQPGRTVEASISPATKPDATGQTVYDPGMVTVDYLVNESKPWTAYVQLSNTGTETTGRFRERIGASDSQVTNHDDIASLDYIGSSDFKTTSAIFGSYDYPLLFPDRLRAKVYGSWGDFNATTPALAGSAPGQFTGSSWTTGLDLTASPFAIQGFAIDFVVGAAAQHITVTDLALNRVGTVDLLTPHVTVRASRETEANKVSADIGWETNLNNVSADDLLRLGRLNTEAHYQLFRADFSASTYLEPFLYGVSSDLPWERAKLAHEVSIAFRSQSALGHQRLIPQQEQAMGGFFSVRGYPEAVVSGDDIYQFNLEYRYHVPRGLRPASELPPPEPGAEPLFLGGAFNYRPPRPYGRPDWDLILRTFFDAGYTVVNAPTSTEAGHQLTSVGVGIELQLLNNLNLRFDYGEAMSPVKTGVTTAGVYSPGANDVHAGDTQAHLMATFVW